MLHTFTAEEEEKAVTVYSAWEPLIVVRNRNQGWTLTLPVLSSLQYRAWWKERYGTSAFSDEQEVEALLTERSRRISCSPDENHVLGQSGPSQTWTDCQRDTWPAANRLTVWNPPDWSAMWLEGFFMSWSPAQHTRTHTHPIMLYPCL